MITSDEGSGNCGSGTDVDSGIEVHVDPLIGQGGADDHGLSGFQNLFPDFARVLFSHQRRYIRFDRAGAKTHDEDGNNQTSESRIRVLENRRSGGTSKDCVTNPGREIDMSS